MRCEECTFWHNTDNCRTGQCRRHAPTIGYPAHQQFPLTEAHLWCGEFEPIGAAGAMIEDVRQQEREACIEDIERDCGHEAWCNKASVIRTIRGRGPSYQPKEHTPKAGRT
jgi:hypothetical protein